MATTIREVLIKVGIEQRESKLRVPEIEKIAQKTVQHAADAEKKITATQTSENFKRIAVAEKTAAFQRRKAQEEADLTRRTTEFQAKHFDKLGKAAFHAASGAAQLARGVVLLGASDDDMEKLIRKMVGIQAGFDIVHGGVGTVSALNKTIGEFAKVSGPAAAGSIKAIGGALGPVTVLLAVGAAAAHTFFDAFGIKARAAAEQTKRFKEALEEGRKAGRAERDKGLGVLFGATDSALAARRTRDEIGALGVGGTLSTEASIGVVGRDRARISAERTKAEAESLKVLEKDAAGKQFEVAIERRAALEKRVADLRQQEVTSLREEGGLLQKNLETMRQQADVIRGQVESQREQFRSAAEELGRLQPPEQKEAERLAARASSGAATEDELQELERLSPTLAREIARTRRMERGEDAANRVSSIITGSPLTGEGSRLEASEEAFRFADAGAPLRRIKEEIEKNTEEQRKAAEELETAVVRAGNTSIMALEKLVDRVERIARELAEALANK